MTRTGALGHHARPRPPELQALVALADRYDMVMEVESIPRLGAAHGLDLGHRPA